MERKNTNSEKEQIICQPSLALMHENLLSSGCTVIGTERCCKASVVINSLVKKAAKDRFRDYRAIGTVSVLKTGCPNQPKATGKVAGIDYDRLTKETRERDLVYWDISNQCILECISYTNGRFVISKSGFYYVFSQIKYKHDPDATADIYSRQCHALHRYSLRRREQKLLENTRTYAELHNPENNGTSYIGAVLRLEINDEIMIKSSHTHRLSGNDKENCFGLYRIQ